MRNLEGARVLITGAGAGIGRCLADAFAARGSVVYLADRDRDTAEAAAAAIRARGGRARAIPLDVTRLDDIRRAHEMIHADGGAIHILVNNAGTVTGGAVLDVPLQRHLDTISVNLTGVVAVTHAFLPDLMGQPEAHLVNIASASAFVGLPFAAAYGATKWGVVGFSESVRLELVELGHRHVGVTCVCPSFVRTGLFDGVTPPLLTWTLTPERVAALTVRAVRRRRAFVRAPFMVALTPTLRALLPLAVFDRLARLFGVTTSMRGWRGHGPAGD